MVILVLTFWYVAVESPPIMKSIDVNKKEIMKKFNI